MRLLLLALLAAPAGAASPDMASLLRDLDSTQNRHEAVCERMHATIAEIAASDRELLASPDPDALLARREAAAQRVVRLTGESSRLAGHSRRLIEDLEFAVIASNVARRGRPAMPDLSGAADQLARFDARHDGLLRCVAQASEEYAREARTAGPVLAAYRARVRTRRLLPWVAAGLAAAAGLVLLALLSRRAPSRAAAKACILALLAVPATRPAPPPDTRAMLHELNSAQNRVEAICERMRSMTDEAAADDAGFERAPDPQALLARRDKAAASMKDLVEEAGRLDGRERSLIEGLQFGVVVGNYGRIKDKTLGERLVPAEERLSEYISRRDRLGQCVDRAYSRFVEESGSFGTVRAAYEARRRTRRLLLQGGAILLVLAAAAYMGVRR